MKVFWEKNNLWNKAKNIIKLHNNNFFIPETYIIHKNKIHNIKLSFLQENKNYILRPSFNLEDSKNKSFAWYFKSIFSISKNEIIKIFKEKSIEEKFNWKWFKLNSVIIQEFVKTNIYWVYFTRNPNNIFKKWYYEIWTNNEEITSWNKNSNLKLNFLQEKELEIIWKKLEKIFKTPQDIEFCIKNSKIILLQTRAITSWNHTIYNFSEIQNFNWIYKVLDFDELWEKSDYFSYKILKWLFNCIYLDSKIYFKNNIIPYYLFKSIKTNNKNLELFYKNYKKYLFNKIFFNIIKFFSFQKLDLKALNIFFQNYKYSFLLKEKSNLNLNFNYQTNFITKQFLKLEKQKNKAFYYLEQYKKEYSWKNLIEKNHYNFPNKLIFLKWLLINQKQKTEKYNWIYKWKISGIITDLKNFKYKKDLNQVLITENLNLDLYDKLEYLSGIIIKNWNSLSHNSIILREYKIPSITNYKDFDKLKFWKKINL